MGRPRELDMHLVRAQQVTFPDFDEAFTDGETVAEAIAEAADWLEETIAGRIARREDIPAPSPARGRPAVVPGAVLAARAALYEALRDQRLTNSAFAVAMGTGKRLSRAAAAVAVAGKPGQKFDLVVALFGVSSQVGEPDLLYGKVRWLFNAGETAVLMYNGRKPDEMDFYRKLGTKVPSPDGMPVSDDFWSVRQGDPDWLTVVGSKHDEFRDDAAECGRNLRMARSIRSSPLCPSLEGGRCDVSGSHYLYPGSKRARVGSSFRHCPELSNSTHRRR